MIRYDLVCEHEHAFDSWFRNSAAYDEQAAEGSVECPVCSSRQVSKRLMTPGLPVKANRRQPSPISNARTSDARTSDAPISDAKSKAVREALNKLRQHVEKTADYVGADFPEEARRIYYKESKERGIYGEASLDDAKALHEEGIEVLPLPPAPEDRN